MVTSEDGQSLAVFSHISQAKSPSHERMRQSNSLFSLRDKRLNASHEPHHALCAAVHDILSKILQEIGFIFKDIKMPFCLLG